MTHRPIVTGHVLPAERGPAGLTAKPPRARTGHMGHTTETATESLTKVRDPSWVAEGARTGHESVRPPRPCGLPESACGPCQSLGTAAKALETAPGASTTVPTSGTPAAGAGAASASDTATVPAAASGPRPPQRSGKTASRKGLTIRCGAPHGGGHRASTIITTSRARAVGSSGASLAHMCIAAQVGGGRSAAIACAQRRQPSFPSHDGSQAATSSRANTTRRTSRRVAR